MQEHCDSHTVVHFSLLCLLKAQPVSDSGNVTPGPVLCRVKAFHQCEHLCSVTTCTHAVFDLQLDMLLYMLFENRCLLTRT